jgi:hypothetical protein
MPSGESLTLELQPPFASALRIDWDPECLRELQRKGQYQRGGTPDRCWSLAADPDWGAVRELSLLSACFNDGALLAVAALRPREANGHDADLVEGVMVSPDGDTVRLHEVLLSREYGPDGKARRLGLELYERVDGPPVRLAADRVATEGETAEGAGGGGSSWTLSMAGTPGIGVHELIRGA